MLGKIITEKPPSLQSLKEELNATTTLFDKQGNIIGWIDKDGNITGNNGRILTPKEMEDIRSKHVIKSEADKWLGKPGAPF